jgi:nicotinamidase-related amidase
LDVIIVVDMQVGMSDGTPKHDLPGLISRINALTAMVRDDGGRVIWIRHCGNADDSFEKHGQGWEFLPDLVRMQDDLIVDKTLNDPFVGTSLANMLTDLSPRRVIVTGWATDFCVDATVRSAVSHGHHVVAVSDGHTLSDRSHLPASAVITHHNWVWSELITNRTIRVLTTNQLLTEGTRP